MKVKKWWKTISSEGKLRHKKQPEKGEKIVDICCTVRFAHISACTIYDNADIIIESAKSETKAFV